MAIVVPLSDLMYKLTTDESIPICDPNINKRSNFLIIEDCSTINSQNYLDATINLQSCPAVSCSIVFTLQNEYLQGKVTFNNPPSNLQYEMSFYYANSKKPVEFLETLNVSHIEMNSNFCLKKAYEFYSYSSVKYPEDRKLRILISAKRRDSISIKLEIPKNEIASQFASLYKDQLLTDFKIICEDKEFGVHKAVLAVRCSVFRAMFQHERKETLNNQIEITDFGPKIVEEMISFLYEDKISTDLTQEELEKTIMIANKYLLEKLKIICLQQITRSIENVSEALEIFMNAKSYNVPKFKEAVLKFIKEREIFTQINKPVLQKKTEEEEVVHVAKCRKL